MITEQELDAATVKAIDSINRLMFVVDIGWVADDDALTAKQYMNQIRRFEVLWRQRRRGIWGGRFPHERRTP